MPTKYSGPEVPDLKAEVVAILLHGWTATVPPGVPPGPHGFGGGFLTLFEASSTEGRGAGAVRLWREHETFLRRMAAAWHWTPRHTAPDGRRVFYAEALALGVAWDDADDTDEDED